MVGIQINNNCSWRKDQALPGHSRAPHIWFEPYYLDNGLIWVVNVILAGLESEIPATSTWECRWTFPTPKSFARRITPLFRTSWATITVYWSSLCHSKSDLIGTPESGSSTSIWSESVSSSSTAGSSVPLATSSYRSSAKLVRFLLIILYNCKC